MNQHNTAKNELRALESVLQECYVPSSYYSLEKYSDECVCIENTKKGWEVYLACRGDKKSLKYYRNFYNAAIDVINRTVDGEYIPKAIRKIKRFKPSTTTIRPTVTITTPIIMEGRKIHPRACAHVHTNNVIFKQEIQARENKTTLYFKKNIK